MSLNPTEENIPGSDPDPFGAEQEQQPDFESAEELVFPTVSVGSCVDNYIEASPEFEDVVYRVLREELISTGVATLSEIEKQAGLNPPTSVVHPNELRELPWDPDQLNALNEATRKAACKNLDIERVDELLTKAIKDAENVTLIDTVSKPHVSATELLQKLEEFCCLKNPELSLPLHDLEATRVRLARICLSDDPTIIQAAKKYVTIPDYLELVKRTIGYDDSVGRIGGKAAGEFVAYTAAKALQNPEQDRFPVAMPESHYLTAEVMEGFLDHNNFHSFRNRKYWSTDKLAATFENTRKAFKNGKWPKEIDAKLIAYLEEVGEGPIIVRSSSLLEDRTGAAFSGKYDSLFLFNQGSIKQRLRALKGAIGEVYAGVLSPDAIAYRKEHDLLDYEEDMAILLQKVVGTQHGRYFLPAFSGVAFSRNEYVWTDKIKKEDGMMRLVMGLGVGAVDRSGSDYARLSALSCPDIRPETDARDIMAASQGEITVIDSETKGLARVTLRKLLEEDPNVPLVSSMMSVYSPDNDRVYDGSPRTNRDWPFISFNGLLRDDKFTEQMKTMLQALEGCMEIPVDIEFSCDGESFFLLQCRPKAQYADNGPVRLPRDVPLEDVVFEASRLVPTAEINDLSHIVYVSAAEYAALGSIPEYQKVADVVRQVNEKLPKGSFMMIGPGRWGSRDESLGVPVGFAGLSRCALLVEVADIEHGFSSELSFGTHFFNDLVESNIRVVPLFPKQDKTAFNMDLFEGSQNSLAELVPEAAKYADVVRVIDVSAVTDGKKLQVAMDGTSETAIAYLK